MLIRSSFIPDRRAIDLPTQSRKRCRAAVGLPSVLSSQETAAVFRAFIVFPVKGKEVMSKPPPPMFTGVDL